MKIVQIMPEFGLAGAEIMCENLIYELKKLGHTVIAVSLYDFHSAITDRLEAAGIDVRYLGKKPGLDLSMTRKLKKLFKAEKPDVIHTHRYTPQYAVPAAIGAKVKTRVHTLHSIATKENGKMARKLNKLFFKHFKVIPVALSDSVRDTVVREYKLKAEKIPVIPNGIDLTKCRVKDDYRINGNFRILHIGRFSEAKNHTGLLAAFNEFHKKHTDSELWLIGDGEGKAAAEKYVTENGLDGCVSFLGLQADVHLYLHDADIFTLPSIYEGIPMTLIEAMGTGLPVVATRVGGIPDMLNGDMALLVPVEVPAIAAAFESYRNNEALRKAHGQAALGASERFSSKAMAEAYVTVYQK